MRKQIRSVVIALLDAVPLSLLRPLRAAYMRMPNPVLERILKLVRHRHLHAVDSFTLIDDPAITLINDDSHNARHLYWFGRAGYEPSVSRHWEDACRAATGILEIGANIGLHTIIGARAANGPYMAVEPHPVTAATLRRNLEANNLLNGGTGSGVVVIEAAVVGAGAPETLRLMVPNQRDPTSAHLETVQFDDRAATDAITVKTVEASTLVEGVGLIKIDAEGSEYVILKTLDAYLRAHKPTLFIEMLEEAADLRALLADYCRTLGYQAYAVADALAPVAPDELLRANLKRDYNTPDVMLQAP